MWLIWEKNTSKKIIRSSTGILNAPNLCQMNQGDLFGLNTTEHAKSYDAFSPLICLSDGSSSKLKNMNFLLPLFLCIYFTFKADPSLFSFLFYRGSCQISTSTQLHCCVWAGIVTFVNYNQMWGFFNLKQCTVFKQDIFMNLWITLPHTDFERKCIIISIKGQPQIITLFLLVMKNAFSVGNDKM